MLRKSLERMRLQEKDEWLDNSIGHRAVPKGQERKAVSLYAGP